MKIFNSNRAMSVWGSSQPKQLLEISHFLVSQGFEISKKDSDLYSLVFTLKIDADIEFTCSISRIYEDPLGVFNFQTYLILFSHALRADAFSAKILDSSAPIEGRIVIFSIGLQHLKWNAEGGRQPCLAGFYPSTI